METAIGRLLLTTAHVETWLDAHLHLCAVALSCQQQIVFLFFRCLLPESVTADIKQIGKLIIHHARLFSVSRFLLLDATTGTHGLDELLWCWVSLAHVHASEKVHILVLLLLRLGATHQTKWILNRLLLHWHLLGWCSLIHKPKSILRCGLSWCLSTTHIHTAEHIIHLIHLLLLLVVVHKSKGVLRWSLSWLAAWAKKVHQRTLSRSCLSWSLRSCLSLLWSWSWLLLWLLWNCSLKGSVGCWGFIEPSTSS